MLEAVSFPTDEQPFGVRRGAAGSETDGLTFTKFGLVVHANKEVLLEITDAGGADFALDWGISGEPTVGGSITVGPCVGSDSQSKVDDAAWVVFAGGTWLSEPACVTYRVTSKDDSSTHRLGVGTACET